MNARITAARIASLCPNARQDIVQAAARTLDSMRTKYGVTSRERMACFMAQVAVESAGFQRLQENLHYSADRIASVWPRLSARAAALAANPIALANAAYAFKNGNGSEASGDGWKYRGRGLIQITGADNYRLGRRGSGEMIFTSPDLAAQPVTAAIVALWFWMSRGCNELADAGDVDAITRKINGPGMEQANIRRDLTTHALTIFS